MTREMCEQMLSGIGDGYLQEAIRFGERRKTAALRILRRTGRAAACLVCAAVLAVTGLTAATASGSLAAYEMLCGISPDLAGRFVPVSVSCEDQGILMKVDAVYVHGEEAEIYISLRDLEGERIDGTVDLFDSYDIHTNCDQIGGCSPVAFDPETGTATFLIKVKHMGGKIAGKRMTFSVSKLLTRRKEAEIDLSDRILRELHTAENVQPESALENVRGYSFGRRQPNDTAVGNHRFLKPDGTKSFSPTDGVRIEDWGFVDEKLHILAYYEDIFRYDNHGWLFLRGSDGEDPECFMTISYFDEEKKGCYVEYLFDVPPESDPEGFALVGRFTTCGSLVKGKWQVSFPVENRE